MNLVTKVQLWAFASGVTFGLWMDSVAAGVFMFTVAMGAAGMYYELYKANAR